MTAKLFTLPREVILSNAGALVPGAKANFYINGTTTPQDTYTASDLQTANANPVVADGNGRFPPIYLDSTLRYKVTVTDASDVEIYTEDDFTDPFTASELGQALWPRTAAEIAASVTPSDYGYEPGNVFRYGATGDGVADDTQELQDALDSNDSVYLPSGTYLISTVLSVSDDTVVYGDGPVSEVKLGANIDAFELDGVSDVTLRDFKINGVRGTYTSNTNDGVPLPANGTGCTNILIKNLEVVDMAGAGIIVLAQTGSHSQRIRILDNYVFNTGAHGIICQDYVDETYISGNHVEDFGMLVSNRPGITTGRTSVNHRVIGNFVKCSSSALGTSVHCISIDQCDDFTVSANVCENHIGFGVEVVGASNGSVTGNTSTDGDRAGIVVTGTATLDPSKVTITGNTVTDGLAQGVYVHDGSGTQPQEVCISGNVIDNCATVGVQVEDTVDVVCSGNIIRDCGRSGVWTNLTDRMIITDNLIKDNNTTSTAGHAGIQVNNGTGPEQDYILRDNIIQGNNIAEVTVIDEIVNDGNSYRPNAPTFATSDATPDIGTAEVWKTADTTTYTDFDGARGDGHTL